MNKNVVIVSFSGRKSGNCAEIAKIIEQFHTRTNVQMFNVVELDIHACGECNYECLKPGEICPNVTEEQQTLMDALCKADMAYFIVPNYCGYPSANYFAFHERSVGYFNLDREKQAKYQSVPKRFIIVSNTEGNQFESAMQQHTSVKPEILYLKTRKYQKQSIAGDLMTSEQAQTDLLEFLQRSLNNT